jgi:hypothetical protein
MLRAVVGRFKERTKPVPGNHEYYTEGARGYFEYFGEAAGDPEGSIRQFVVGTGGAAETTLSVTYGKY